MHLAHHELEIDFIIIINFMLFCCRAMHGQLLALRKLVQLLDPPMHAFMEAKSCLNYFFCYRWLLIHFKREFAFDEVSLLGQAHPMLRYRIIPCQIAFVMSVLCPVVSFCVSSSSSRPQSIISVI